MRVVIFSSYSLASFIRCPYLTLLIAVSFVDSQLVPEESLGRGCRASRGQFSHETFCHQYYNCWDGRATIEQCPGDLLFNQITSSCDYPEAVNCAGRIRNPAPFISGGRCLKEWGVFPDPLDCTAFYECAHGRAFRKVCNIYTAFDERYLVCVHAHTVECNGRGGIYGTLSPPIYIPSASGPRGAKAAIGSSGWERKPQQQGSSQVGNAKGSPLGAGGATSRASSGHIPISSSVTWTGSMPARAGSMDSAEGSLGSRSVTSRNGGSSSLAETGGSSLSGVGTGSGGSLSGTDTRGGSFLGTGVGGSSIPAAGGDFSAGDGSVSGSGTGTGSRSGTKTMQEGISPGDGSSALSGPSRGTMGNVASGSGTRGSGDTGSVSGSSGSGGSTGSIVSGITGIVDKDIPPTDRERQYEKPISQEATFRCPHPRGLYSYALDCTRFWLCREYRPSLLKCPTGQLFDLASLTCTNPEKAQCSTLTPRT